MRKYLTPSGSVFYFEGSLEEGLTIQTSGIRDNTGVIIDIPAETINVIKNLIKKKAKY